MRIGGRWDEFYARLAGGYRDLLAYFLNRRWLPIVTAVLLFVFAITLFGFVGGEFIPEIDQNIIIIQMNLPAGTSLERTRELASRIETVLREHSEVEGVIVKIGGGQRGVEDADIIARLVDASERSIHVTDLMNVLRPELAGIPDAEINVTADEGEGGSTADLLIEILSNDQEQLEAVAGAVHDIVLNTDGLVEVQTSLEAGKPEIAVLPRRRQLAGRGLSTATIGSLLRAGYEGLEAGVYREGGEEYDIIVKYAEVNREDPSFIPDIPIPSYAGYTFPLSDVGELSYRMGDSEIQRKSKQRMITVTANIATGSLSEARSMIDAELGKIDIPPSVTVRYGGAAEIQDESFASIFTALILAIILVYIVMAAILESFVHPFTVMLTLPLGLIGVALGLFFSGSTINIFSLMSVVMLVGIVVNNAILLLDYTSQLRAKGMPIKEALLEACPTRLRPIIMANLAIAVGMIPQVMKGAGSEIRAPMAYVQIGGVLVSAVFTLFIIPVAYTIIDRFTPRGRMERRSG